MAALRKEVVQVVVDGEVVSQETFVDPETELDVDPNNGQFRTRHKTEELIAEVYRVGRSSLQKELERYNKWVRQAGQEKDVFVRPLPKSFSNQLSGSSDSGGPQSAVDRRGARPTAASEASARDRALGCKDSGNAALQKGDLRKSVAWYSRGLRHDPTLAVLWANRAEAHLRLRRFSSAIADAEHALGLDEGNVKVAFRKSTALCRLGKRRECFESICYSRHRLALGEREREAWQQLETATSIRTCPQMILTESKEWCTTAEVHAGDVLGFLPVLELPSSSFEEVLAAWEQQMHQQLHSVSHNASGLAKKEGKLPPIPVEIDTALGVYWQLRNVACSADIYEGLQLAPSPETIRLFHTISSYLRSIEGLGPCEGNGNTFDPQPVSSSFSSDRVLRLVLLACVLGYPGVCLSEAVKGWAEPELSTLLPTGCSPSRSCSSSFLFALGSILLASSPDIGAGGATVGGRIPHCPNPNVCLQLHDGCVSVVAVTAMPRGEVLRL